MVTAIGIKYIIIMLIQRKKDRKPQMAGGANMTQEEFDKVLENHQHWLNRDCKGWEDMKAELGEADLHGLDLEGANLQGANMYRANLQGANMYRANLQDANLNKANLQAVILREANLSEASLNSANLEGAALKAANLQNACIAHTNLCRAELPYADLSEASLYRAELCGANLLHACLENTSLAEANFSRADLRWASLYRAYIGGINLYDAKLSNAGDVPYIPMICPEEGEFIGWKKALVEEISGYRKVIVKLKIPKDAKRSSATTRKCRCSKAKVLAIYNLDGTEAKKKFCRSDFNHSFIYEIGKIVKVDDFEEDRWKECAEGIHFFMNRQEALNY